MMKSYEDYEKNIENVSEIEGTDVKINPDYYIHNAIIKAQSVIANDNIEIGFIKFCVLVDNIETLADAAGQLPDDYEKEIEEFIKKDNKYNSIKKDLLKQVCLANYKKKIILKNVFAAKVSTSPMRM